MAASKKPITENAVFKSWTGDYQGLPPFDEIEVKDFKPAIEAAMDKATKEYEAIGNLAEAPTFEKHHGSNGIDRS